MRLHPLAPALLLLAATAVAQAGDPNACDAPGDEPNVIVGDLYDLARWGKVGDVTAFSLGTISCNVGTCWLQWLTFADDPRHPTIGQNFYRMRDGRFEQIGQSWLKHGFYALSEGLCSPACLPTDGEHLGVNCSDPYWSGLNGQQTRLGPKFEVNPLTGEHPHPVSMQGATGDEVFKRLQVHDRDLDPALNPGALYFIEGQYIAADDAAAGNQHDNASYRPVDVQQLGPGEFHAFLAGTTQRTKPAIQAWQDHDPTVELRSVDDPEGGRFWAGAKVTDLGGGRWSYEYAVQNLNSHRAAGTFSVPMPPGVTVEQPGFHDVDYHSGEPFDLTDWAPSREPSGSMTWSTTPYQGNPNANALRWGTLYNFRFVAHAPPAPAVITLGMFKPGGPGDARRIGVVLPAPVACNGDGACDPGESCVSCPGECSASAGPDVDGDGVSYCEDCDDNDRKSWATPGEARMLLVTKDPAGAPSLTWQPPDDGGATAVTYETLRSTLPSDFVTASCLTAADPAATALIDTDAATAGPFLSYLVRACNRCALGEGTTGTDSFGTERNATSCP
jgi:hypothetical protein